MKTEEEDQMAAAKIEEKGALREKAQEAATPRILCARTEEGKGEEESEGDTEEAEAEDEEE